MVVDDHGAVHRRAARGGPTNHLTHPTARAVEVQDSGEVRQPLPLDGNLGSADRPVEAPAVALAGDPPLAPQLAVQGAVQEMGEVAPPGQGEHHLQVEVAMGSDGAGDLGLAGGEADHPIAEGEEPRRRAREGDGGGGRGEAVEDRARVATRLRRGEAEPSDRRRRLPGHRGAGTAPVVEAAGEGGGHPKRQVGQRLAPATAALAQVRPGEVGNGELAGDRGDGESRGDDGSSGGGGRGTGGKGDPRGGAPARGGRGGGGSRGGPGDGHRAGHPRPLHHAVDGGQLHAGAIAVDRRRHLLNPQGAAADLGQGEVATKVGIGDRPTAGEGKAQSAGEPLHPGQERRHLPQVHHPVQRPGGRALRPPPAPGEAAGVAFDHQVGEHPLLPPHLHLGGHRQRRRPLTPKGRPHLPHRQLDRCPAGVQAGGRRHLGEEEGGGVAEKEHHLPVAHLHHRHCHRRWRDRREQGGQDRRVGAAQAGRVEMEAGELQAAGEQRPRGDLRHPLFHLDLAHPVARQPQVVHHHGQAEEVEPHPLQRHLGADPPPQPRPEARRGQGAEQLRGEEVGSAQPQQADAKEGAEEEGAHGEARGSPAKTISPDGCPGRSRKGGNVRNRRGGPQASHRDNSPWEEVVARCATGGVARSSTAVAPKPAGEEDGEEADWRRPGGPTSRARLG
ncbi:MAG: hypothetical protein COW73_09115 [Nitrospirae bacterium CG18_big_fil_WC_8_21_14_2_50_70_55]|nr:MAG: hypothetical protein COW73_09115 [Nitrospirae bacterium CG18_big_fil_WC_8_21_14_2_50_70_55]